MKDLGMKLDHISYAVKSTDDAIEAFGLFYSEVDIYKHLVETHNVYITYLSNTSFNHRLELVEPADSPNPVANMLTTAPSVLYHVCYRVNAFAVAIEHLRENGFFMATEPFETTIETGCWASHLYSPHCGLIEIIGKID